MNRIISSISSSLRATLIAAFATPLLGIFLFQVLYFPAHQKALELQSAQTQVKTLSEMLAFAVGAGLKEGNFDLVQTAFEWSKKDRNVAFVSINDETNSAIVEHNPGGLQIDKKPFFGKSGIVAEEPLLIAVSPIQYGGKNLGTIILGYSLDEMRASMRWNLLFIIVVSSLTLGIGLLVVLLVSRKLVVSINGILVAMERFADGDLTVDLPEHSANEIGRVYKGFNRAVSQVRSMMIQVVTVASETHDASSRISTVTEEMAAGAQEQTSQAHEVASAVEEMTRDRKSVV
jgi:methyl-accepting chemotaxis protein